MLDWSKVPGYKEAEETEAAVRELPFLGVNLRIAGIDVMPMTLRHFTILSRAGSPWIVGGVPTQEDAALFVWVVSTQYETGKKPGKDFFAQFVKGWDDAARDDLDEYVDLTFMDAPGSSGNSSGPIVTCAAASYVHAIAKHYHWSRETILSCPLIELHQYLKRIQLDSDSKAIVFNKLTDKVRGDFLREWNAVEPEQRGEWLRQRMEDAA